MRRATRIPIQENFLFLRGLALTREADIPKIEKESPEASVPIAIPIDAQKIGSIPKIEIGSFDEVAQGRLRESWRPLEPFPEIPPDTAGFFWNYERETGEAPAALRLDQVLLDLENYELFWEKICDLMNFPRYGLQIYRDCPEIFGTLASEKFVAENLERVLETKKAIFRLAKTFNKKVSAFRKKTGDEEQSFLLAFEWLSREIFSKTKYEKGRNRLLDIFAPEVDKDAVADCEGRAKALVAVLDRADLRFKEGDRIQGFFEINWEFFSDHVRVVVRSPNSGQRFVLENGLIPWEANKNTLLISVAEIVRFFMGSLTKLPFPDDTGVETRGAETNQEAEPIIKRSATIFTSRALDPYHQEVAGAASETSCLDKKQIDKKFLGVAEIRRVLFNQVGKQGKEFWRQLPKQRRSLIKNLALTAMLGAAGAAFAEYQGDRVGKLEGLSDSVVDTAEELSKEIKPSENAPDLSISFVKELDRRWQEHWTTHFDGTDYLVRQGAKETEDLIWTTSSLEDGVICDEIGITPEISEREVSGSFWKQIVREAFQESGDREFEVERTVSFTSPDKRIPLSPNNIIGDNGQLVLEAIEAVSSERGVLPEGFIKVVLDGEYLAEIPFKS